jgi:hypothetical protein
LDEESLKQNALWVDTMDNPLEKQALHENYRLHYSKQLKKNYSKKYYGELGGPIINTCHLYI